MHKVAALFMGIFLLDVQAEKIRLTATEYAGTTCTPPAVNTYGNVVFKKNACRHCNDALAAAAGGACSWKFLGCTNNAPQWEIYTSKGCSGPKGNPTVVKDVCVAVSSIAGVTVTPGISFKGSCLTEPDSTYTVVELSWSNGDCSGSPVKTRKGERLTSSGCLNMDSGLGVTGSYIVGDCVNGASQLMVFDAADCGGTIQTINLGKDTCTAVTINGKTISFKGNCATGAASIIQQSWSLAGVAFLLLMATLK